MAESSAPLEVELKVVEGKTQRQLNLSAGITVAFCLTFLMLAMVLVPSTSKLMEEETDY